MMKPRLVLCSGAQAPSDGPLRDGRRVIELDTLRASSNTHLLIHNVTRAFARQLPGRFVDLLEIATYVFTADCEASRELAWVEDKSTEPWSRDFRFVMPVRDLAFWQRSDVQTSLVKALEHLSSDRFGFDFVPLRHDRKMDSYLRIGDEDLIPFKGAERVIMFSGGLDSLAGAAETAHRGEPLVLVSHTPVSSMKGRQSKLFRMLKDAYDVPMMHIPVWVNKRGHDRESTQRTRSFLFSALGATVARFLGIGGVRFFENGVISLNLPLADEALRSRASRTTNPWSMYLLQEFHRLVADRNDFIIDNPYIFNTKTEVVSSIVESGAAELIGHSCSCSHTMFQSRTQRHCGRCGQCIDRRIAVLATKQEENDPDTDYESCVFTGERPVKSEAPYDHNIAVNYVRFARDMRGMSENGVAGFYNQELTRAARCSVNRGEAARQFIAMHKRHAETVRAVLADQIALHSCELTDHSISRTSLLYMALVDRAQAAPNSDAAVPLNRFHREGHGWVITYQGQDAWVKGLKGVRIVAYLLELQGREHPVSDLTRLVNPPDQASSDLAEAKMTEPELEEQGLHTVAHPRRKSPSRETVDIYREALRDAEDELQEAQRFNDPERMRQAQEQIAFYRAEITKPYRRTPENPDVERARLNVRNLIVTALDSIAAALPPLGAHLRNSIRTGLLCSYAPDVPVEWDVHA